MTLRYQFTATADTARGTLSVLEGGRDVRFTFHGLKRGTDLEMAARRYRFERNDLKEVTLPDEGLGEATRLVLLTEHGRPFAHFKLRGRLPVSAQQVRTTMAAVAVTPRVG